MLARTRVRFVGEALAVVIADNRYAAEDAIHLIDVEYEELPPVLTADGRKPDRHVPLCDEVSDDIVFRDH